MPLDKKFTVSLQTALVKSTSTSRKTLDPLQVSVPSLLLETSNTFGVANDNTPVSIPFGGITIAKVVQLISDEEVTVKFNGDTTGITFGGEDDGGVLEIIGASISSMTVQNNGADEATFAFYLAGAE